MIAASLQYLFLCDGDINNNLARKVTAIINRQYKKFINGSSTDIYFATFFLDPCKFQSTTRNHDNFGEQVATKLNFLGGQLQWATP